MPTRLGWATPDITENARDDRRRDAYHSLTYVKNAEEAVEVSVRLQREQEADRGPSPEEAAAVTGEEDDRG